METLPSEIHSYIAHFVCLTDHGPSIRSLSLASRYFNAIAKPYIYHTVSLTSDSAVFNVVRQLDQHEENGTRNIRNLFVSSTGAVQATETTQKLHNAVIRLITLASPSLVRLTVDCTGSLPTSTTLFSRVLRIQFPKLEDLTLAGFYPFPNSSSPTQFPLLKRLYLYGNRNPYGLIQMGNLSKACPELRELRVGGLSMAVSFVKELKESLGAIGSDSGLSWMTNGRCSPSVSPISTPSTSSSPSRSRSSSFPQDLFGDFNMTLNFVPPSPTPPTPNLTTKFPTLGLPSTKLPPSICRIVIEPAAELEPPHRARVSMQSKDESMMAVLRSIPIRDMMSVEGGLGGEVEIGGHGEMGGDVEAEGEVEGSGIWYILHRRPLKNRGVEEFRSEWKVAIEND